MESRAQSPYMNSLLYDPDVEARRRRITPTFWGSLLPCSIIEKRFDV